MKIGVFTVLLANRPFEEALDYLKDLGVEAVEIGCGAYPGDAHCKPSELLSSDTKLKAFQNAIKSRGLMLSALSVHGNPLHPNKKISKDHHAAYERALKLARKLDVDRVITFSGCPGADAKATAKAGIYLLRIQGVPAFAGMTTVGVCNTVSICRLASSHVPVVRDTKSKGSCSLANRASCRKCTIFTFGACS